MLVPEPCDLLVEITPDLSTRYLELACDHEGAGGRRTPTSLCEARLALTLEHLGVLTADVRRPERGDVQDGNGIVWDFKSPRSQEAIRKKITEANALRGNPPPTQLTFPGEFVLEDELLKVISEQAGGEGVIVDLRRLTYSQAVQLRRELERDDLIDTGRLLFFPEDLAPYRPLDG